MIPTRVLGLSQSMEIDCRPEKKFRQGFYGVRVGVGQELGQRGSLGGFPTPVVVSCAGDMCSSLLPLLTPCFCFQKCFISGNFWSFCILSITCLNWACLQLLLVPYSFFVFRGLKSCLFRCKPCRKWFQVSLGPGQVRHWAFPHSTHQ